MAVLHAIAGLVLAAIGGLNLFQRTPPRPALQVPSFEAIQSGESIEMNFRSSGCFHTQQYLLRFTRAKELTVNISTPSTVVGKSGKAVFTTRQIGNLRLSEEDAIGLDNLIRYYRSKPKGGCTTVDSIFLTFKRGNQTLATELFTDRSCNYGLQSVVRVEQLVERLKRQGGR